MMKSFFISIFVLFVAISTDAMSQSFTYKGEEVNKVDENGKKQGKWVILGKMKPSLGYAAEEVIETGNYTNSRKTGLWKKYYKGGKLKSEINYKLGRPYGKFTTYYSNGVKEEEGNWKGSKYTGELTRRHKNGKISQEVKFNDAGKMNGTVKYFYENGKPELVFNAANGIESGKATRYYENGDVKEVTNFNNGVVASRDPKERVNPPFRKSQTIKALDNSKVSSAGNVNSADKKVRDGYNKIYNENEDLWKDGEFKGGSLWNGKLYVYDKDGLLLKIKLYKQGKYYADGVIEF